LQYDGPVRGAGIVVMLLAGCVRSESVVCGDGSICPPDSRCVARDLEGFACARADQVAACVNPPDDGSCEDPSGAGAPHRCYGGACFPIACGDGFVDPLEVCPSAAECCCGNGVLELATETCDDGDRIGNDGCHACAIEEPIWRPQDRATLPLRIDHASVYDVARDRVVVFGDRGVEDATSTLEHDGEVWLDRAVAGTPTRRASPALAYDPVRARVVLFGGSADSFLSETWELDGRSWTFKSGAIGPDKRSQHAMVYDPGRARVVMFGGSTSSGTPQLDDTWLWDGTTWEPAEVSQRPPKRARHGMAYDANRGVVVVAGGIDGAMQLGDTWELGSDWSDVSFGGIRPFGAIALAYDPATRSVLGFGGDAGPAATTWLWDGVAWTRPTLLGPTPSPRFGATLTTHARRGTVILFGGCTTQACSAGELADTWEWNGTAWIDITAPPAPPPTAGAGASTFDVLRRRLVRFGGQVNATTFSDQIHEFDGRRWLAPNPALRPPGRLGMALAFDVHRAETIVFGGSAGNTVFADTWRWNGTAWSQAATPAAPPGRVEHAMVYDVARRTTVMFGGGPPRSTMGRGDTWLWDGTTWTEAAGPGPSPRRGHVLAYDPVREQVVLYGGMTVEGNGLNDTWIWDGAWRAGTPPQSPDPRRSASLAWDGARRRLVLFGGVGDGSEANTSYEWDGTTWSLVPAFAPPVPRSDMVMFPAGSSGLAVFGTDLLDVHVLRWEHDPIRRPAAYEVCASGLDLDVDGKRACEDEDCWIDCHPLAPPGSTGEPVPGCGDGVCDVIRETCGNCAADCTCAPVCGDFTCASGETCAGDC
jgi:cysteine-rich repeat protein